MTPNAEFSSSARRQKLWFKVIQWKIEIWKYDGTQRIVNSALEHLTVDQNTPEGLVQTDILLTGGMNGSLWLSLPSATKPHKTDLTKTAVGSANSHSSGNASASCAGE
ncbi:hypothetical protein MTR67_001821 [Solanum verrucosum]|uniref:Uncharacterized protein n=1 Tax=Solanum verrucosum TaxID=315347 RepID=A0AAF0T7U2_SOLVR|nr:hypothetical protein MTR67_001821 [Solanum verrucosum]